jgi:hypothetical protein
MPLAWRNTWRRGPHLLARWRNGWAPGEHPRGAALVAAAVDARRAGMHEPLACDLLFTMHEYYLSDRGAAGFDLKPGRRHSNGPLNRSTLRRVCLSP